MRLRKFLLKDTKALQNLFLNEKNLKDTGVNVNHNKITLKFMRDWLKERIEAPNSKNPSSIVYAIINNKNNIIGTIGLGNINYKSKSAFIGYWISEKYSGKGNCTFAIKIFLEKIPKLFDLKKITSEVSEKNIASYKVLKKNSFKVRKKLKGNLLLEKEL